MKAQQPRAHRSDRDLVHELADNGFVFLPSFFSAAEVEQLLWLTTELILMPAVEFDDRGRALYDDDVDPTETCPIRVNEASNPDQVCRIEDLLTCSPALADFVGATVTPTISRLGGTPFVPFKDKLNFKHPGGGAFTPHQDYPAYSQFAPRYHLTAMITIDPATPDNGCLQFPRNYLSTLQTAAAAGEWQMDPIQLRTGRPVLPYNDNGDIDPAVVDLLEWEHVPTEPRDLVLFDSYVPHQSFVNISDRSRRAIFLTHNAAIEGEHCDAYYRMKRADPNNALFHWAVPSTVRRS